MGGMSEAADNPRVFYPAFRYDDARAAIAWLGEAFGFVAQEVYDGPDGTVAHAQLTFNGGMIMLGSSRGGRSKPKQPEGTGSSVYAYVADVDAHCARARAAGARIVREPCETDYGSREYSAEDCEGYGWSFGTYHP